jgi:hypothetical protein
VCILCQVPFQQRCWTLPWDRHTFSMLRQMTTEAKASHYCAAGAPRTRTGSCSSNISEFRTEVMFPYIISVTDCVKFPDFSSLYPSKRLHRNCKYDRTITHKSMPTNCSSLSQLVSNYQIKFRFQSAQ